jgi:transcriptional regulator with XRE-family HTH domain
MHENEKKVQNLLTSSGVGRIGKAVVAIRNERHISQKELADRTKLANGYLSQIENDKKLPSLEALDSICQALNVPMYVFLLKAKIEESINDPDQMVFLRQLKPAIDAVVKDLYYVPTQNLDISESHKHLEPQCN